MSTTVAYDLTTSVSANGISSYTQQMLRCLLTENRDARFLLLIRKSQREEAQRWQSEFPAACIGHIELPESQRLQHIHRTCGGTAVRTGRRLLRIAARLTNPYRLVGLDRRVDLVHNPHGKIPTFFSRVPIIVTQHDLQELHFPEFFSARERQIRATERWQSLTHAGGIIVSYRHAYEDVMRYFAIPERRVQMCPITLDPRSFDFAAADRRRDVVRTQYALPDRFMLYPAMTLQHKNHIRLLQALHQLIHIQGREIPPLICTGHQLQYSKVIETEAERLGLREHVRFLGPIPRPDLLALYRLCTFVVIPTLYEAGSYPLMEAMLAEAPVICSRTTSLPETIGDVQFTFDATDVDAIAQMIARASHDDDFRAASAANGRAHSTSFTTNAATTADAVHALYRRVLAEHSGHSK